MASSPVSGSLSDVTMPSRSTVTASFSSVCRDDACGSDQEGWWPTDLSERMLRHPGDEGCCTCTPHIEEMSGCGRRPVPTYSPFLLAPPPPPPRATCMRERLGGLGLRQSIRGLRMRCAQGRVSHLVHDIFARKALVEVVVPHS